MCIRGEPPLPLVALPVRNAMAVDQRPAILSPARLASQLNPTDSRPVVENADVLPDGPEDK
jgi:hypothetical protein